MPKSRSAEAAFESAAQQASAVSTDMEDLAAATPPKPGPALLLPSPAPSPVSPVSCAPVTAAEPTVCRPAEHARPIASLPAEHAEHAEQDSLKCGPVAQPQQASGADATEYAAAEASPAVVHGCTRSATSAGIARQSVEEVVEKLLKSGQAMHQAESEARAPQQADRSGNSGQGWLFS